MFRAWILFLVICLSGSSTATAAEPFPIANMVRNILNASEDKLDYAHAKVMIDRLVDPSVDVEAMLSEIDRMAGVV